MAIQAKAFQGRLQVEGRLSDALSMARTFGVRNPSACPLIVLAALAESQEDAQRRGAGRRGKDGRREDMFTVPRNRRPRVSRDWITGCYVFDARWVVGRFDQ